MVPASLLAKARQLKAVSIAPPGFARFWESLGEKQRACAEDDSQLGAVCCPRRAGKSTSFIGKTLRTFARHPGRARVCFTGPSIEQAIDIIWDDVERFSRQYDLGLRPLYSDQCFERLGSRLDFAGFSTRKEADKLRGQKFHLIGVDESQLGPEWFGYMLDEAILPTLLDYGGKLWLYGTPGLTADGFFFDACHSPGWSNGHSWTYRDNPFFRGRDITAELEKLNIVPGTPKYQREWEGKWVIDPEVLVFRIPDDAVKPSGSESWFLNVGGLDLGHSDGDAITVVGIRTDRRSSHLRHAEEQKGQTNAQLLDACKRVAMRFGLRTFVCDTGGLGKKIVETFRVECPQIQWVAARKEDKLEHIEMLNSDMASGKHTVESGSLVIRDSKRVRWGKQGKVDENRFHSDVNDAWLYAYRYARQQLRELPVKSRPQDPVEAEYFAQLAEEGTKGPFRRIG